jgi:hypothetical protein
MSPAPSLLDDVKVAKPCPARWEEMTGDERVRHCAACDLDVFNLSGMRGDEAEEFVAARTGTARTCIRFRRRADGTMITRDCPVGVRAAWRKAQWAAAALLAGGFAAAAMFTPRGVDGAPEAAPFRQIHEFVLAHFYAPPPPMVMGDMVAPSPPAAK